MATEELFKIRIIGMQKDKIKSLDYIHEKGIIHISSADESSNEFNLKQDFSIKKELEKISVALLELKWAEEYLETFAKNKKKIIPFRNRSLVKILDDVHDVKKSIHHNLSQLIKLVNNSSEAIEKAKNKISLLKSIPFKADGISRIDHDGSIIFSMLVEEQYSKNKKISIIPKILHNYSRKATYVTKGTYSIIQGLKSDKEDIIKLLKESGVDIVHLPSLTLTKEEEINHEDKIIAENIKILQESKAKIKDMSDGYYDKIVQLKNDLTIFHERYEITHNMLRTEETFQLQGYVSKREYKIVKRMVDYIPVHIIADDIKEGPSKLWNLPYVKHFEFITKMFGYPKYNTVDPTLFVSLFMPFFFGFMFSDIGYGILLLAVSFFLLLKIEKENKVMYDSGFVLFICSLSTIIFGLLFGSFFGNLIKIEPLLFDPFTNAKYVLIAGLGLGLIHLNLGMIIGVYESLKKRNYKVILFDYISIFSLQAGGIALALSFINDPYMAIVGGIYIIIAVILFVIKNSLMGIMDISGFFGTWFSYARLLALSLATGGIALGVNIMAQQVGSIAFIGPILFMIIIIIGHLFNFAMNLLGSTIHSVRLHYIEFFSRFYEGGGKPFKVYTTEKIKETL